MSGPAGGLRPRAELETDRLILEELGPDDADEMAGVLADESLYEFIGGRPPTIDELRKTYRRLARGHSADGLAEWRNWIVRRRDDHGAVGTAQATIVDAGRTATIAWIIGAPWQGRGFATEAARAVVGWLEGRGVKRITASVHPEHRASAGVASRAGLVPTDEFAQGERVWSKA